MNGKLAIGAKEYDATIKKVLELPKVLESSSPAFRPSTISVEIRGTDLSDATRAKPLLNGFIAIWTGCDGVVVRGVGKIVSIEVDKGFEVTTVDISIGADWILGLPKLCELNLGVSSLSKPIIEAQFPINSDYDEAITTNLYYSTKAVGGSVPVPYLVTDTQPDVYIAAIFKAIVKHIEAKGYTVVSDFLQTSYFKRLLYYNYIDWSKIDPLGYLPITATWRRTTLIAGLGWAQGVNNWGEFLNYNIGVDINESQAGLIVPINNIPLTPPGSLPAGNLYNADGQNGVTNPYWYFLSPASQAYNFDLYFSAYDVTDGHFGFAVCVQHVGGAPNDWYYYVSDETAGFRVASYSVDYFLTAGDRVFVGLLDQKNPYTTTQLRNPSSYGSHFVGGSLIIDDFQIEVVIKSKKTGVIENDDFKVSSLLPCRPATDLLKAVADIFNLVFVADGSDFIIAPVFDIQLPTNERVSGYYKRGKQQLPDLCTFTDSYDSSGKKLHEFKWQNDSTDNFVKDKNLLEVTLATDALADTEVHTNSMFAATYSENGIPILSSGSGISPRLLFKHGPIQRNFEWANSGNIINITPTAFCADANLSLSYINFADAYGRIGYGYGIWRKYIDFTTNGFTRDVKLHRLTPFKSRELISAFGVWWVIESIGSDGDETSPKTLKLRKI